jgi:hypothetical protein
MSIKNFNLNMNKKLKLPSRFLNFFKFEFENLRKGQLNNKVAPFILQSANYRIKNSPLLSGTTLILLQCFNLNKLSNLSELSSIDLFFDDLNYLDKFVANRENIFLNFKKFPSNPYSTSSHFYLDKFHYDNVDYELDNFVFSFDQEDMFFRKYQDIKLPHNYIVYSKFKRLETNILNYYEPLIVLKRMLTLLKNEERYYVLANYFFHLFFWSLVAIALSYLIFIHFNETISFFIKHRYHLLGTEADRFWLHLSQFFYHPIKITKTILWAQWMNLKLIGIAYHDAIIFKNVKNNKVRKILCFYFQDHKKKMRKYPDLFRKYFW